MSPRDLQTAPGETDAWTFDFGPWLDRKGEEQGETVTIASATWSASTGAEIEANPAPTIFDSSRQIRAWFSVTSDPPPRTIRIQATITTSAGHVRTAAATFDVRSR